MEEKKINNTLKVQRAIKDLTQEQLENLLSVIDSSKNIQAANLMKFALFTGMRRGELFKLKWELIFQTIYLIHLTAVHKVSFRTFRQTCFY